MSPVVASRRLTPARVLSFLFANLVWLAPFFLAPATNASAATDTYYVHVTTDPTTGNAANCPANSAAGGGSCSLRDAMTAANADATATAIVVDMTTVSGTITLGSNLTQISLAPATTTIEFDGPGANALTVSGNNAYQEFVILDAGGATFQNFTVANGFVSATGGYTGDPGYGAAIYAYLNVPLTLTDMVITNNYAANGAGGVLAGASIAVTQTTFSNNSVNAANGGIAGALYAIGSPATIYQSTFSGNSAWIGASIYIYSPVTVTISDSTFANNATLTNTTAATGGSGGIYNSSGSTLTIHDSTLWNNTATYGQGAALNNSGTMTVTDSIVGAAADTTGAAECYTSTTGCPTNGDANGNVTAPATFNLAALGSYGGPTQTVLPLPGSAAVCGGKTGAGLDADASGNPLTQDQRTLPLDASCAAGTTDAGSVQVNYLTVTTTTDSNDGSCTVSKCSLRDAITAANTANSGDIAFSNSLAGGTINLASNLPGISATGSVNIVGPSGGVIIDGGGKYQPFYISSTSASVGLVNLTLQNSYNSSNGGGVGYGAAILDYGTLSVTNVNFLNNAAGTTTTQGEGAAILNANASPLTVTDCYFANNTAIGPPSDGIGGAILTSGTTTITGSTFYKNSALTDGGAIYTVDGNNLTISNSTFGSNSGPVEGGAIWSSGPLTATNSTFADNTSADGTSIFVDGANASLTNSILDAAEACDATGCPGATDASTGNVVGTGAAVAGTVDNNGGSIPTALPVGASLCGGNASLIPGGYTDERGDTTVDPHCTAGLMDSGAVQSDYTSVAFSAANYDAISASPIVDPSVIVYVYEFGNTTPATSAGGVPITLDYTGTGTVNAGGTASTVAGSGATYSALTITSTATTPQPVSAAILGSSVTAATATITFKQGTATTTTPAAAAVPFSAATQNVTLNATLTPAGINEGNVTFTVCTTATNPCTGTVIGTATASGTVASSKASVSYALPAGLAIGSYTIDAEYIDGSSGSYASSKGTATLKVTNVTIAPTTLTAITVGVPMTTQTLTASGGTGPYTYAVTTGSLPAGISLNASTGALTGTATEGGSIAFTVTATDSLTATGTQAYTWTVNAATLAMAPTPGNLAVSTNITFTQAFTASAGTAPYTYTETGTLPTGLTWTAGTGTISGKTTQTGSFPITITAKDSSTGTGPYTQGFAYTLVVTKPAITIAPTTLTAITVGTAMTTQTLVASGGTGPYSYTVTTGSLPAGISLNASTGALTGTATQGGSIAFTVTATDANANTGTQAYTWTVNAATLAMAPTPGNLAVSTNITFTQAFTASAGTAPYTYTETGTLPTGLTWTAGTGTISGKATQTGSFPITVTAKDSSTGTGPYTQGFAYTLVVSSPTISIAPTTLTAITVGVAMPTQTLVASGGTGPYSYTVTTGSLPAGISLNASTGALTGTATQGGSIA
ncbi:MAG: putative Ig domain-containing protein, partial [Acidobacteriaceae bacterium]